MTTRLRRSPYQSFSFVLELDRVPLGGFAEVSGLDAVVDTIDHRDGSEAQPGVRKLAGLQKYSSITLKRGLANRAEFYKWQAGGPARRRAATIVLRDAAQTPVTRWHLANAWISKIVGPSLSATGNDIAIETLELTHEGLTLAD